MIARFLSTARASLPLVVLGPLLFGTGPLAAQHASITGRIMSAHSGDPIQGAEVNVLDRPQEAVTSEAGLFRISGLPEGRHILKITYMGAKSKNLSVDLGPREAMNVALDLEMKVLPVPELVVTVNDEIPVGKLYEFRRRAETGPGYYITREEIAERNAPRTTALLRRVPGLRVGTSAFDDVPVSMERHGIGQLCTPGIYVDGAYAPFFNPNNLQPRDIAGIEIYRGTSEVPVEYRRAEHCGVMVFWTRDPSNWRGFQ